MVNWKNPKPHFEEKTPPKRKRNGGGYFSKETMKRMIELIEEGKKAREEYFKDYGNSAVC
ncbi:MAG: hypothetical protein ABIJ43_03020 [Candidatus Beckwithbacteria bacterium]|nr:hypothetical protein [Patescibacteria group bacterium]